MNPPIMNTPLTLTVVFSLFQMFLERRDEEERMERDRTKQEQEVAYQEAQLADQV